MVYFNFKNHPGEVDLLTVLNAVFAYYTILYREVEK